MRGASAAMLVAGVLVGALSPLGAQDESERARVLRTVEAALAAVSAEDMIAFTDLMIDEAVLMSAAESGGAVRFLVRERAQERARTFDEDIVERGFDPEVRISGPLAMVWLPYDLYRDGAWSHCGVDTFTLLRVEGEWRIATLAWTVEQPPACRRHPQGPPETR